MNIEITALKKPPPCRIIGSIRFSTDHKALEIYNNEAFPPNFKHCITDGQPVHRRIRVIKTTSLTGGLLGPYKGLSLVVAL